MTVVRGIGLAPLPRKEVELVPVKSIIPAADASAAPASKTAIAVICAAKNRVIIPPKKKSIQRKPQAIFARIPQATGT
jgi:hypothetical protein